MADKVSVIAIAVPRDREAVVLSEETMDTYVDFIVDSLAPSLYLFIQSDPPTEVRMDIIEGLVGNGIGMLLHAAMLLNGAPLPEPFLDRKLMGALAQNVQDAAMARLTTMIAEMTGELGANDD